MQSNTENTYAWRKAIDSSRPIIAKITIKGKRCNIDNIPPAASIVQANPARILSKQWPDIILAKSRSAKLTSLKL